jgi:hypothetical protein
MNRKKKNYNPLKMWGAWLGGVLGLASIYLLLMIAFAGKETFLGWLLTDVLLYPLVFLGDTFQLRPLWIFGGLFIYGFCK